MRKTSSAEDQLANTDKDVSKKKHAPSGNYVYCPWDKCVCDGKGECPFCGELGVIFEKRPTSNDLMVARRFLDDLPFHPEWELDLEKGLLGGKDFDGYHRTMLYHYPHWTLKLRRLVRGEVIDVEENNPDLSRDVS